ncbi:MAG: hypothetical protein NUV61_02455 [Candidatus Azambacteria bacterium]|nr:hypothetical protein [Candidatus Azambacteria bacterium]
MSILIVVDFPAPFGPINATRSPLLTLNEILSTAFISLISGTKRFFTHPADWFLTGNENLFDKLETIIESLFMRIVLHKYYVFGRMGEGGKIKFMNNLIVEGPKKGLDVIKKEAEKALASLENQLNMPVDFPVLVRLHESRAKYEKQLGRKTQKWEVGNTSANGTIDIIHPNSFKKYASRPKSDFVKILKHELWHTFAKRIAGKSAIPCWLNEGMAMCLANQADQYQNRRGYYIEEGFAVKLSTAHGWNTYANYDA